MAKLGRVGNRYSFVFILWLSEVWGDTNAEGGISVVDNVRNLNTLLQNSSVYIGLMSLTGAGRWDKYIHMSKGWYPTPQWVDRIVKPSLQGKRKIYAQLTGYEFGNEKGELKRFLNEAKARELEINGGDSERPIPFYLAQECSRMYAKAFMNTGHDEDTAYFLASIHAIVEESMDDKTVRKMFNEAYPNLYKKRIALWVLAINVGLALLVLILYNN